MVSEAFDEVINFQGVFLCVFLSVDMLVNECVTDYERIVLPYEFDFYVPDDQSSYET